MFSNRPTIFFLKLLSTFFVLFFCIRIAFLSLYAAEFQELDSWQTLYAFIKGAYYFDSSITFVFLGIPFLLTYLPWRWTVSGWYLKFISWYSFSVLFFFAFLAIGDLLYFGIVHRHAGHEVGAAIASSGSAMLEMAISAYWLQLLVLTFAIYVSALLWRKWMMPAEAMEHIRMGWLRAPFFMMMFLMVLLIMRGGIESKPIQAVFAYNEGSMAQGHLTLNGAFSVLHGLEKSKMHTPHFMPMAKAVQLSQQQCRSESETVPNMGYPLMRERSSALTADNKPNVVILLLESWDSDFVDITRELQGKKSYAVTPNYNALAKKGRLYTNFYANGQRSIDGITALIAGIPTAPGAGYLGEGIEVNNIGWLGKMAQRQGYSTSFLSGSYRHSFYMDKIAPLAGFESYLGSEDLLTRLHPDAPKSQWGGWDYDLLMTGQQLFEKSTEPFLSVLFTVTTHSPWTMPDKKWEKYAGNSDHEKFLNTLYYTDWVLGEFFKAARKAPYFENTIFILFGDHASGHMAHPSLKDQHRTPLLILGPDIKAGIDHTLSSQVDLIPSIIDLAGWQKSRYAGLGVSLMQQCENRSVVFTRDNLVGRIENDAMVVHNLERVVTAEGSISEHDAVERRLKAQVQVLLDTLEHNTLMALEAE